MKNLSLDLLVLEVLKWSNHICKYVFCLVFRSLTRSDQGRKYEHSKTFGLITSPSSNVLWTQDEDIQNAALRQSGAGRAIVGADEEVLCWDVKKGELLSRWRDQDCVAEVTSIARSTADPDVYAVGYVFEEQTRYGNSVSDSEPTVTPTVAFGSGTQA